MMPLNHLPVRLREAASRATSWLRDQIVGPYPETEADRIRDKEEAAKVVQFPLGDATGKGNHLRGQ